MIEVRPATAVRRDFARYAHTHSARTLTASSFAIGDDLFPTIPEPLLLGATVDGQPYHPTDSTPTATAPATKEN